MRAIRLKTEKMVVVPIKGERLMDMGAFGTPADPTKTLAFEPFPALSTTTGHMPLASCPPGEGQLGCTQWSQHGGRQDYSTRSPLPQNLCTLPVEWHLTMGSDEKYLLANSLLLE